MGKHKNSKQEKIFVNFMESHSDLAKGLSKGVKSEYDALWLTLTQELNNAGPPTKDYFYWKKTWSDWKANIKRKIRTILSKESQNQPIYSIKLSKAEETVARICNLYEANESLDCSPPVECLNTVRSYDDESLMDIVLREETSTTTQDNTIPSKQSAKNSSIIKSGQANSPDATKNHIGSNESVAYNDFSKCLGEIAYVAKSLAANAMMGSSPEIVQNIADSLDGWCSLYAEENKESARHNRVMEDLMREKISIKMRSLELQELQYKMIKEKQEKERIKTEKV